MGFESSLEGRYFTNQKDQYLGQKGWDKISDTNVHNGEWFAIKADGAADAVFTTLTCNTGDSGDGMTLLAGDVIYGSFTSIDLTSGTIYAYRK